MKSKNKRRTKYFLRSEWGWSIDFDNYIKYLESIKEKLPTHIYDFFSDDNSHTLHSPTTLHDSRFHRFTTEFKRKVKANEYEENSMNIILQLVHYDYENIIQINYNDAEILKVSSKLFGRKYQQNDLLWHKLEMASDDEFIHTMLFHNSLFLEIKFKEFAITKFPIPEDEKIFI